MKPARLPGIESPAFDLNSEAGILTALDDALARLGSSRKESLLAEFAGDQSASRHTLRANDRVAIAPPAIPGMEGLDSAITFIKRKVGKGTTYQNAVARAVFSETGAYYQLHALPQEFSGAVDSDKPEHKAKQEKTYKGVPCVRLMPERIERILEAVESVSAPPAGYTAMVLYEDFRLLDCHGMYLYDISPQGNLVVRGSLRSGTLPAFVKIRLKWPAPAPWPELLEGLVAETEGMTAIIVFALAPEHTDDGRWIAACLPRADDTIDLMATVGRASTTGRRVN